MRSIEELEAKLAEPSAALVSELVDIEGDIMILGAAGKMGPSLAKLARNASNAGKRAGRVIAVSRFSNAEVREELEAHNIDTITADLLNDSELQALPAAPNVIFMVGSKFGTTGREHFTWACNTYLPGRVAEKFRNSRIVAFSTGNVYPLTPVIYGGSSEENPTGPIGEYAQSSIGRERMFEHFSRAYGTLVVQFRLNYAIGLRYGVLLEVAQAVRDARLIDLQMGHVNVIWQADANEQALRSLRLCSSPPEILNVTGPETVSVRWLAHRFGEMLGREPSFVNNERDTALLSNASKAHAHFGYPRVSLRQMMQWTVEWLDADGPTLDKPTRFQEREGAF
jgi:nucleoside-diphosphate-sugar epimerase